MNPMERVHALIQKIDGAASYQALFGPLPGNHAEQKVALTAAFRSLVWDIHPDRILHFPEAARSLAGKTFRRLVSLSREAREAIDDGRYHEPFDQESLSFEVESSLTSYRLSTEPHALGDAATIYCGQSRAGMDVLLKVALAPSKNPWLDREIEWLERFHAEPELGELARFMPEVLDTFLLDGEQGRRRATVFEWLPDQISLSGLIKAFPLGLAAPDAAWICRRLLAQVCAASMFGVVHGALVPDHLMVGITTHDPWYIGWSHAVEVYGLAPEIVERWRDYYAPEALAGQPLDGRSDLYMAGQTMTALLGGDPATGSLPRAVPDAMAAVIRRCVEPERARRYSTGKHALDELSLVARRLWGKKYRRLVLPTPITES